MGGDQLCRILKKCTKTGIFAKTLNKISELIQKIYYDVSIKLFKYPGENNMEKKKSFLTLLFYCIPIVAAASMLYFGYLFYKEYAEYKAAEEEYAEINDKYIKDPKDGTDLFPEGDDELSRLTYFPDLDISFAGLKARNKDLACVLYIPVLKLKYPVVYSSNNEDYLHRTFEGSYNFSGCIFYDCYSKKDFEGYNTFLFGHNMKNGSMFGRLKTLGTDKTAARHPYFYIYTDGLIRKYEIFSFYQTTVSSDTYMDVTDDKNYDTYISLCKRWSAFGEYKDNIDFKERPGIVTLSTCTGQAGGNDRFVVHGALIATKKTGN